MLSDRKGNTSQQLFRRDNNHHHNITSNTREINPLRKKETPQTPPTCRHATNLPPRSQRPRQILRTAALPVSPALPSSPAQRQPASHIARPVTARHKPSHRVAHSSKHPYPCAACSANARLTLCLVASLRAHPCPALRIYRRVGVGSAGANRNGSAGAARRCDWTAQSPSCRASHRSRAGCLFAALFAPNCGLAPAIGHVPNLLCAHMTWRA
jgi:hypothetical protein